MKLWKINCMEDHFPGMWQRWYQHQCVAVGWSAKDGYHLNAKTTAKAHKEAWKRASTSLSKIEIGDYIVVSLKGHRVGRIGEVTKKAISDETWEPLVPISKDYPYGEMGRRIFVRWDLTVGPENRGEIVHLPEISRFSSGELRPTISEIKSHSLENLKEIMNDQANWESLFAHFDFERSLSGYIATYPHHLEDGLTVHPDIKIREHTFANRRRTDVVLIDRQDNTVIVECKQREPTVKDIEQLKDYLFLLKKEKGIAARGILVHGGSQKLSNEIVRAEKAAAKIEVVQHKLAVQFSRCF